MRKTPTRRACLSLIAPFMQFVFEERGKGKKIFLECQFSAAAFAFWIIKILLSNFRGEHNMHHIPKIASVILFRLLKSAA
jgi:hypothetical protein